MTGALETALRTRREAGGKSLVPYLTGGLGDDWLETIQAVADAGADAIEIGVPFSDPVMDGPVIQLANDKALASGATPLSILDRVRRADIGVPTAVMTYGNIAYRMGWERFANTLADGGVSGCILPDIPLEETGEWVDAADAAGVETVMLAAPTAPDDRLPLICERSRGFVYAVGLLGITGVRAELADSAKVIAGRVKAVTDKPVLVGVGIGTPEQAVQACEVTDGVVVGSAIVQRMLDGTGPEGVAALVSEFRAALDG
ncbi:MAG: tryptophan synthase subunit alpha [Acidimicrobiales bacterium]|jgi:tryptophan synthase alpha chain|nr:tryptophan synthase subunit alpha [Acidimicrobiales bacterium]